LRPGRGLVDSRRRAAHRGHLPRNRRRRGAQGVSFAQVFKVARREYLARVRNKAFIVMTVLVPVFLGAYMFAVPILARSRTSNLRLAVLDAGTGLGDALAGRLRAIERPHIVVTETATIVSADPASRERFNATVRSRALDGYLMIE